MKKIVTPRSNLLAHLGRPSLDNDSGFTIIELLAVTVLLALMSTILYSSLSAVLNGRELVSARKKVMLTAEHIFSQLGSDLAAREAITLDESSTQNSTNTNPTLASGFSGFGVRKFMSAEDATKSEAAADTLKFVTHSFPITVVSKVRNFGLIEVLYKLEELPRDLEKPNQDTPTFRLLRQEIPAAVLEKKTREYHQATHILADSIIDFNLRFLIQGKWSDKWSASGGRAYPEAIEITLGILDEEQNPHRFRTAIAVSKQPQGAN